MAALISNAANGFRAVTFDRSDLISLNLNTPDGIFNGDPTREEQPPGGGEVTKHCAQLCKSASNYKCRDKHRLNIKMNSSRATSRVRWANEENTSVPRTFYALVLRAEKQKNEGRKVLTQKKIEAKMR
ncbi:hypothetical protein L798_04440 [Zootermopsis nevadensis]|uniref:Uncharacterized protein n=1 Tax=Zootermopsis nevadensis TaxID=136037 RepID=A0A067QQ95_ZOONE|nr:hypothetical protein L798_04440 [Zootermopsis nevadensis]